MGKLRSVGVKFIRGMSEYSGQTYNYVTDDDSAKVGDYALVIGGGSEMCLTKIVSVQGTISPKATKCVVAIVSLDGYEERQKNLEKRMSLLAELEQRVEAKRREKKFEDELAGDEEGMALLKELRELEGTAS